MTLRPLTTRSLASVAFAAALVSACTQSLTLDNVRLQQSIQDGLQQQAGVQATVTCPGDQPLKKGNTSMCTALTSDGTTLQITVVQTDDQGTVDWNVTGSS